MTTRAPLRTVVAGTNFGRFYLDALAAHPAFELVGVLARGSAQSGAQATRLGVPRYTDPDQLPADVDAAVVAVPGGVAGGAGSDLARRLLGRGMHVLAEHPLHPDEVAAGLRAARTGGACYRVNTHYHRLAPVAVFLAAAARLRAREELLFVDAAASVHVLAPLVDLVGRTVGTLRPWRLAEPTGAPGTPIRTVHARLGAVPIVLRVAHRMHPHDRDNHALFWHRISVGTAAGVLALADTHGPVLWHPRLHSPRDPEHRLVLTGGPDAPGLDLPTVTELDRRPGDGGTRPSHAEAFATLWPDAIAAALTEFAAEITDRPARTTHQQWDLSVAGVWRELAAALGPPDLVLAPTPTPLPATALLDPDQHTRSDTGCDTGCDTDPPATAVGRSTAAPTTATPRSTTDPPTGPAAYDAAAEFFDLAAATHTARSAPAAVAALAGLDPSSGPLLDIGAGTGLITVAVAAAYPDLQVLAAEPSPGMRAVLTARVAADRRCRDRITVDPATAQDLAVPGRICGALLCGVAGHLDAPARLALFDRLRAALPAGGPVVVELLGLPTATAFPPGRLVDVRLGERRYTWQTSGTPVGADLLRLHSHWQVHGPDGAVLREVHDTHLWHCFTVADLAAEVGWPVQALPAPHDRAVPHLAVLRSPGP